ncbi:GntR family transcriptional regulator [Bradyrhizobium sp. U87765 SZCCT0131]|uniref:GntR family transcriptional regulator n=1 Tax=unclassified Bradyrhizobium TaxID=2631580 RepID=UPI001BA62DEB|nr:MULTISPECIES: GntR family transcriptional regulator [unclassified Bradyrhizobium]MBR1218967.1 GntR family transcriptional regulator [Bradyrhizobium sp. U87765 SZCCT0131]MBR1261618.1 GntR family transcriptional regulator [Bradyrhizobium sp. U87765 SZCCT0134]MBR1306529.1 GntR family transcriptional regulator [Bradyrhizobium sp. U87765 SZCCT0110]MBR1317400.1 GntR family transcriptional regulator [Bradyrhizobium sp. U87765 SZCCT0109]MBR1351102.1 GntR family transcriptional regulator [Bradyrhizo
MSETVISPASSPRSASTQSRLLAERLRQALLDGAFPAGSRLNEVHLARTLEVSRTPLRAALQTLAGEGLLHHTPNRGFTVPEQSLSAIVDAYEMRALAEGLAARLAAERGLSDALRQRMEDALADGDRALAPETADDARRGLYAEANAAFHAVIHEAAQSQLVRDVLRICQRVPQTSAHNIVAFDLDDVRQRHAAHRQIYEAIICREPREAERLMRQHVLAVKLSMARWFGQQRAGDAN